MSEWMSYYKNEEDEEEEEYPEEVETGGEYKYAGRDSLIFLVDASKAMFEYYDDDEWTPFDMTIQCIRNVYTSKIISSDRDLLSVVFYGTEKHKNSVDFKHVYVLQELDNPGAKRVLELDKYKGDQGKALFRESFGHNADYSLGEALWACCNLFSDVQLKMSHKRIMLFTNEDNPHGHDSTKAKLARTKAADLRDTGIFLDLMHLKKPGGFDISLFYRDIINTAEDEDLGVHTDASGKLEHLMKKVRAKETKKRALARKFIFMVAKISAQSEFKGLVIDSSYAMLYKDKTGTSDIVLGQAAFEGKKNGEALSSAKWFVLKNYDPGLRILHNIFREAELQGKLNFHLGKDLSLTVGVYNLVQKAFKPSPVKLYRETNEPVKTKTRTFNRETGSLLLPSDTKKAQTYGNRQIVLEKEEVEEVKRFDSPGLVLIGFKPLVMLKQHYYIKPSQFIYPEESFISGSTTLFNALLTKCLDKEVMALCRYTPRRNTPPRFVALVPQEEELDEQKVQTVPPGFHLIFLPYADDKRKIDFTEKVPANDEQVDKMKEIIQKLRFKYRNDSFENPVLQQHFRNLEALALDLIEPEQAEDLTQPKVEAMNHRLGDLVEQFKQLVYPPDYNPEGKAVKRKQGEGAGQIEKKPKMEVSKDELRSHVQKGTLGKFTVPVLKEACRVYGLKGGGKKQELLDALTEYFSKF